MEQNKPILCVNVPSQVPGHAMYDNWVLSVRQHSYIALLDLAKKLMPGKRAETLRFADICAKPGNCFSGDDFSGPRYEAVETRYPGIVIRDMPNPCDRK